MVVINELDKAIFEAEEMGEWLDACFEDEETGEVFFVEIRKEHDTAEEFVAACLEIAEENFDEPHFLQIVEQEEAEILGYDTY